MSLFSFYFFFPLLALYIIRKREKELVYVAVREPALWHVGGRHYRLSAYSQCPEFNGHSVMYCFSTISV